MILTSKRESTVPFRTSLISPGGDCRRNWETVSIRCSSSVGDAMLRSRRSKSEPVRHLPQILGAQRELVNPHDQLYAHTPRKPNSKMLLKFMSWSLAIAYMPYYCDICQHCTGTRISILTSDAPSFPASVKPSVVLTHTCSPISILSLTTYASVRCPPT